MVFGSQGEAFIDVHANTDPYERELERGIRTSSDDAEKILDLVGEDWGDTLADSMSTELGKHGKDYGKAVEDAVKRTTIKLDGKFTIDRHGRIHDAAGRFVSNFGDEIEKEFARLGAPGGPLNRIGEGVADAVGAGFNISGRSPLIALLIPVIGAIAGAIGALIQVINLAIGLLAALPALLASIGLQVGVLFIAFQGLGEEISQAFAAKNAKELEAALFGLSPPVKAFIRDLLPLKQFFEDIKLVVQTSFFSALGTPIGELLAIFRNPLVRGFADIAFALGSFFNDLAAFFGSPTFVTFVRQVIPLTLQWIERFGDPFIRLLSVLTAAATAAMPLLAQFGLALAHAFDRVAEVIRGQLIGGNFQDWIKSMGKTLDSFMQLLAEAVIFTVTFLSALDNAGGRALIDKLAEFLSRLTFFLASPVGQKAMEGMINALIKAIEITGGLIIILLSLFALVEFIGEALNAFFMFLADVVGPAIGEFFTDAARKAGEFLDSIKRAFEGLYQPIVSAFMRVKDAVSSKITEVVAFVQGLPDRARAALGDLKNRLYEAGRELLEGFIRGIKSKFGDLRLAVMTAVQIATDIMPGSPAKEGPLSGQGYSLYRGQRMMEDFAKGIRMEAPELRAASSEAVSNVVFGKGAIQMEFNGATPSREEAQRVGTDVGNGIAAILASQRTRLAVRTL